MNTWYRVLYRWLNQWCRRQAIRRFGWGKQLQAERARLASKQHLSEPEVDQLARLTWQVGLGPVIRLTPEQRQLALQVLDEILE